MSGGAIATFVYADFVVAYPAFAAAPPAPTLQTYFNLAGRQYLRNDGTGPVSDVQSQTDLLYMLTAHMAHLYTGPNGTGTPGPVGRISSASKGSVSVSTEMQSTPNAAWFMQTPYGAAFWQASAAYRTLGAYRPGSPRFGTGRSGYSPRRRF